MTGTAHTTPLTDEQIEALIRQLTLEEKVAMMAGADLWHTVAVPRLGIPALKMSDGPNGARGGLFKDGTTAAVFPVGMVLAQTWNTALIERVGVALAQEAKTKGAQVLLAPTVNLHRSPLGGRNFESFSEDPYLASRLTVAYINGVQSQGIAATVKHYAGNESEVDRYSMDAVMDERTLREVYLAPFEAAVREAHTWALMASYNLYNGVAVSEHPYLLTDILRGEWGWDGYVVSDWVFSVKSTAASVNAGLDIEMPGPGDWRGAKLLAAVREGAVSESTLDVSMYRLLRLLDRVGKFANPEEAPEQAIDLPEHRALIREAAGEGIVLLKNEGGLLPLQREKLKSVAIIGPNAKIARIMGGGSSEVNAHYRISPYDGVTAKLGAGVTVGFEEGCIIPKLLPALSKQHVLAGKQGTNHGLLVEFYNAPEPQGVVAATMMAESGEVFWFGALPHTVDSTAFSARLTGRFTPPQSGLYTFGLSSTGPIRLSINGELMIDQWQEWRVGTQGNYFNKGSDETQRPLELVGGQEILIELEYCKTPGQALDAFRLGCLEPQPTDKIERAVALAAQCDVALIFGGLSGEWDSEGFDRQNLELTPAQNDLIQRVAAANPNTVVVLNTGSAVTMPWLGQVAALLQASYPGQEAGNAIADILFGDVNPSGKLSQTYPVRIEDTPPYLNFPNDNGKAVYGERIFAGYRYYDAKKVEPLFPFGYGLSYTTFAYENVRLSAAAHDLSYPLEVLVDVVNTGTRAGQEVVQVYVHDCAAKVMRPEKELKAFGKVWLQPGERQTVRLSLNRAAFAFFDDVAHQWVAEVGAFDILLGASSRDIRGSASFTLLQEHRWL